MKKLGSAVIVGAAATVVMFFLAQAQQAKAPAPKYFPGESWVYQLVKEEVSPEMAQTSGGGREGPLKMEVSADGSLNLHPTLAMSAPSVYEATPLSGIHWFKFPLTVGKTWPVQYLSARGNWQEGTVKVVAAEIVNVQSGTFETYKLLMEEGGGLKYDVEYWYAPKIKATVKVIQKRYRRGELMTLREFALTSYKVRN